MAIKSTSKTRERERSKSRLKQSKLQDTSPVAPKKKSTSKTRERERAKSRESQRGVTRTKEAKTPPTPKPGKPGNTLPTPNPGKLNKTPSTPKQKEQRKLRLFSKGGKVTRSNNKGKRYI